MSADSTPTTDDGSIRAAFVRVQNAASAAARRALHAAREVVA